MKIICGWCGRVKDPGTGEKNEEISHDMCLGCATGFRIKIVEMRTGQVTKEERAALLDFDRS